MSIQFTKQSAEGQGLKIQLNTGEIINSAVPQTIEGTGESAVTVFKVGSSQRTFTTRDIARMGYDGPSKTK